MKHLSVVDLILTELEHSLRTCHVKPAGSVSRSYPADRLEPVELDDKTTRHVAALMRVNNAGEVAAQGLYRGQAVSSKNQRIKEELQLAANEENEHLNWCQTRLHELNSKRSILDPLWYWGSFGLGVTAGFMGDKWGLGFVEETENQVARHLDRHLNQLPQNDRRSEAILRTMKEDETKHADYAHKAGAATLPAAVRQAMNLVSKVMTFSAYRL